MFSDIEPSGPLLTLKIDAALLIDTISFDPRLARGERTARAEMLRSTALENRVVEGEQYQGVMLEIVVE
jgi:hypothetical protein